MDEEYVEAVLDVVETIPAGRVMTYGSVAAVVRARTGRGGPRTVGQVMAWAGAAVPWWRVVDASGRPPARHRARALVSLRAEGCPLTDGGEGDARARVRLREAAWSPE